LTPPVDEALKQQGVSGELWAVHGGGFYHPVKFAVKPPQLPDHLHWFYWESYSTWLTGFALFSASYLWNASTYLVDPTLVQWSSAQAITAALSFFVLFWLAYDAVCRWFGQGKNGDAIVGALVALLLGFATYLACHLFAGRAAFLIIGAMLGTAMSANVFFCIIPGQRKMVASIRAGLPVDPIHGWRGKQRSVHNTYFTLPVLFAMLSNHYSFTWSHPQNWLVLIVMMLAGAAIRQFFVLRHGYKLGRNRHPAAYALFGVALIIGAIVWMKPAPRATVISAGPAASVSYQQVAQVLEQRCYACHGAQLQMKNVRLDSPAELKRHALQVYQQAVVLRQMPMNNATQITEVERQLIGRWFESGAKVE
jgi:uncharacterized membrane protein